MKRLLNGGQACYVDYLNTIHSAAAAKITYPMSETTDEKVNFCIKERDKQISVRRQMASTWPRG
jgi:hypothetical protein